MNDELEQELAKLRPAATAPELLRKLRATPPPRPTRHHWSFWVDAFRLPAGAFLACALLLLAAVWLVSAWKRPTPLPIVQGALPTSLTGGASPTNSSVGPGTKQPFPTLKNVRDASDVFDRLRVDLNINLAALGGGGDASPGNVFDLAASDSPFRLEPGAALPSSKLREPAFGKFDLIGSN